MVEDFKEDFDVFYLFIGSILLDVFMRFSMVNIAEFLCLLLSWFSGSGRRCSWKNRKKKKMKRDANKGGKFEIKKNKGAR